MGWLIWSAYFLTVIDTYRRVKARRPRWEMAAEFSAMGSGLAMLVILAISVALV